jgi:hypothetical protein
LEILEDRTMPSQLGVSLPTLLNPLLIQAQTLISHALSNPPHPIPEILPANLLQKLADAYKQDVARGGATSYARMQLAEALPHVIYNFQVKVLLEERTVVGDVAHDLDEVFRRLPQIGNLGHATVAVLHELLGPPGTLITHSGGDGAVSFDDFTRAMYAIGFALSGPLGTG